MASRILLISPDRIGKKMAGPGIRYWNFALELARHYTVTLLVPEGIQDGFADGVSFAVKTMSAAALKQELTAHDAVVIQGVTLAVYPEIRNAGIAIIVDLYDPFHLENLELHRHLAIENRLLNHRQDLRVILDQLNWGDYFICASEAQRNFWMGMLSAVDRINPIVYDLDDSLNSYIGVVPFGLQNEPPKITDRALKGVYPGIGKDDRVLIWGGGIWNWFDPLTLIKGMDAVRRERSDIKLFFLGVKHPNPDIVEMKMANEAMELSKSLGLTGNTVFFNHDWVPYETRQNYLADADLGVSSHFDHLETRFSFRTRILDYIWCELPMVLTGGDSLGTLIDDRGAGRTCPARDVEAWRRHILELLGDDAAYATCKANLQKLRTDMCWRNAVAPLVAMCENPKVKQDKLGPDGKRPGVDRIDRLYGLARKAMTKEGLKRAPGWFMRRLRRGR